MIDTHCHLTHPRLVEELDAVVERARGQGVEQCVSIGTGVDDARNVQALIERYPGFVFGSAGLDPFTCHKLGDGFDDAVAGIEHALSADGMLALGEIGLDYHYDLDPKAVQARKFERQLELAEALDLPVVIHVREAHDDMARVLGQHPENRGVIHSFTGDPRQAERYLELGWHLSFNGVLTFNNAGEVRDAARAVPADRLLLETDSPYLAPAPLRGKRCEPAFVAHTLARLAEVRGEPVAEIERQTDLNARRLFRLPEPAPPA